MDGTIIAVVSAIALAGGLGGTAASAAPRTPSAKSARPAKSPKSTDAKPPKPGKLGTPAEQAELAALDQETTALQLKQAKFAAGKLARKALALQTKLTGPMSIEVERRKQTLAGILGTIGDFRGQLALDQELLAQAEKQHGPESREGPTALAFGI